MASPSSESVGLLTARGFKEEPDVGNNSAGRSWTSRRSAAAVGVATLLFAGAAAWTVKHTRGSGLAPKLSSPTSPYVAEYASNAAYPAPAPAAAYPAPAPAPGAPFQCTGSAAALQNGHGDGTTWRCDGGACIQQYYKCNGESNCLDGSDEKYCGATGAAAAPAPAPAPAPPQVAAASGYGTAYSSAPPASQGSSAGGGCYEKGGHSYSLNWKAQGATFWNEWNYLQFEPNSGAAQYLDRDAAIQNKVTVAHDTHAILRPGPKGKMLKRTSAKVETQKKWQYFLMAVRLESVPWGCGVWPALWTHSPDAAWPKGGELDILEYSNELTSRTSFHVDAVANRCKLDSALLNKPGCTHMPDAEFNFTGNYDCVTSYPDKIGCAPNTMQLLQNGEQISQSAHIIAAEWTPEYLKIFRIPAAEMPADLAMDAPRPDDWDKWVMSYYPFAQSERNYPGSCPNPAGLMKAQKIVLSLGFCGDWASKVWANSTCANKGQYSTGPWSAKGPVMPTECVAVDPHNPMGETPAGPRDCCTSFIYDADGSYGTEDYLAQHGHFNITWLKVYQSSRLRR